MHEKIEMKTNTRAVAVTAGWPMALALLVMGGMVLLLFPLLFGPIQKRLKSSLSQQSCTVTQSFI